MKIRLLTVVSHKAPSWIEQAYDDYRKRLPTFTIELIDIPAEKRADTIQLKCAREGKKMLTLIKPHHHVVALDMKGKLYSTMQLSEELKNWQQASYPIDFLIGGADGLDSACLERANQRWSLSPLTFPHHFVRLILIEQLYRAWSILQRHPYHR